MRRSCASYLPLVLALTHCLFAAEIPPKLVGRWRSLETSKGGIGAMLEFHPDGTVDFSPGAVVESPYRIDGHQLIFPSETNGGPEQKMTIAFVGDKLRMGEGAAGSQFARNGARVDSSNPIIGEWKGTRDIEGHQVEMRWLFYASGKSLVLIPFLTEHGHFTVEGATIRFELPRHSLRPDISTSMATCSNCRGGKPYLRMRATDPQILRRRYSYRNAIIGSTRLARRAGM